MAQKFNDGQTFGQIREILNGNADELNSTTETANEAYKEAGLAMGQANAAKTTADEAKTAADAAQASATEAKDDAAEYMRRTSVGGGSLAIYTANTVADFSQVLNPDVSTPNAVYTRLVVLNMSLNVSIGIPGISSKYKANCVTFKTLIYGTPRILNINMPSLNYIAATSSDVELTAGAKSWQNSVTYERARRDFGVYPQGLEVTITLIAGNYSFFDIQVRPLFESETFSPAAAAAALSLEESPRAEVADEGCYMKIDFYDTADGSEKEVADAE